jgi:ferredoxin
VSATDYDLVGFASPTDFYGIPRLLETFVGALPEQTAGPAFVLNTCAALSGATLTELSDAVAARGFRVFDGHSLRMPQSYPRNIGRGLKGSGAPSARQLEAFRTFVARVGRAAQALSDAAPIEHRKLPVSFLDRLVGTKPRTTARDDMGDKTVDAALCTECGTCAKGCPYQAITLDPKPVFDMDRCFGCWRCFNRCPSRAIQVAKLRATAFYSGPGDALKRKFAD